MWLLGRLRRPFGLENLGLILLRVTVQYRPARAPRLIALYLAAVRMGRIQRLCGVSRIKIDPNVGGPGNTSAARVTLEQQVTRDFTLTYVTNTAYSQQRLIQFEWALGENLSLIGVRDQNGIFGVEVKFRRRFK